MIVTYVFIYLFILSHLEVASICNLILFSYCFFLLRIFRPFFFVRLIFSFNFRQTFTSLVCFIPGHFSQSFVQQPHLIDIVVAYIGLHFSCFNFFKELRFITLKVLER